MATHADVVARTGPSRRLVGALALSLGVLALEVGGGLVTGSLALLSDATHVAVDVVALLVGLGAARLATRSPDASHTYGFHRMEALGALVNAVLLVAASAVVLVESVSRLVAPSPVEALAVLPVALIALVTNSATALLVHGAERQTVASRVLVLHLAGDAVGAVAVIVSSLVILAGGPPVADAIASLVIGVLLGLAGVRLLGQIAHLLVEGVPGGVSVGAAAETLRGTPGVCGVHDLHVWALADDLPIVTAHLEILPDADQVLVLRDATAALNAGGFDHVTLQPEGAPCGQGRPAAAGTGQSRGSGPDQALLQPRGLEGSRA
jgi:cobalt-zinc-cadmium efflux system protein